MRDGIEPSYERARFQAVYATIESFDWMVAALSTAPDRAQSTDDRILRRWSYFSANTELW